MNNTIFVVGDRFEAFANHSGVITISELEKLVDSKTTSEQIFEISQGVSPDRISKLLRIIEEKKLSFQVHPNHFLSKEKHSFTHKDKEEDILISPPVLEGETTYASYLLIDDRSEEMSDHAIGQKHLQGDLLIEAASQMMSSILGKQLKSGKIEDNYFILDQVNAIFKQFAFPLELIIIFQVKEIKNVQNLGFKCTARVVFEQAKKEVCDMEITCSVLDKKFLLPIEERSINEAITFYREKGSG